MRKEYEEWAAEVKERDSMREVIHRFFVFCAEERRVDTAPNEDSRRMEAEGFDRSLKGEMQAGRQVSKTE